MNKVILIGRIAKDPTTQSTQSGIKYSRFTIAVDRPFSESQTDFIPIVAWRNQAAFIENYLSKGSLISIEGRFTSSNYTNSENQQVTRYEITAERVDSLETKAQRAAREAQTQNLATPTSATPTSATPTSATPTSATATQVMEFAEENKAPSEESKTKDLSDVPWELDL